MKAYNKYRNALHATVGWSAFYLQKFLSTSKMQCYNSKEDLEKGELI